MFVCIFTYFVLFLATVYITKLVRLPFNSQEELETHLLENIM